MLAGRLDRRITLQSLAVTQGTSGETVETWTSVATVWGGRRDARGREFFDAASRQEELETLFTIRWRDDVQPTWRLLCDGQTWDVRSVAQVGRREGLEMRCTTSSDERR